MSPDWIWCLLFHINRPMPNSTVQLFWDSFLQDVGVCLWEQKHSFWWLFQKHIWGPDCSCKVGSMKLCNMFWYAEALRVPFSRTKGPMQWWCSTPPLHPTLCIPLDDARLACSCSGMKLYTHRSWANLKLTWTLEVCGDWFFRKPLHTMGLGTCWPRSVILCGLQSHGCVAVILNRFPFVIISLTSDCGIFSSEEHVASITVPHWNSLSSWERFYHKCL